MSRFQWLPIYPFDFKAVEKAFRNCVILAFTLSAHATQEAVLLE
jgi:hypothetical protein